MTTAETGTIYALIDPRTNDIRYVGQTTKPVTVRLAGHLAAPAPLVKAWIEDLAVEGFLPQTVPLREGVPVGELDAAEKEEIKAHTQQGDLLNVVGNALGNARRRKVTRAEQKRREAEEEAMAQAWRQASWRKVADQVREATGGPISPVDICVRDIPATIWSEYQAYHEADRYLRSVEVAYTLGPPGGLRVDESRTQAAEKVIKARRRRLAAEAVLEKYCRRYCAAFAAVDDGERHGTDRGIFRRGEEAYKKQFATRARMAQHMSLIPWAARALDPWVSLAQSAGMNPKDQEFTEWLSDDPAVREAVDLCRAAGVRLGMPRQGPDADIAVHALAIGAAQISGFVVPEILRALLEEGLIELTRDRQATREMCHLLQSLNPKAMDAVYGTDELAASDEALGLPPGTSAKVVRRIYGGDTRDPGNRTAKLLQRNSGDFGTVAISDYAEWTGPHVPAYRVTGACFYLGGLFPEVEKVDGEALVELVKRTWKPTPWGLEHLEEMEEMLKAA